MHALVFLLMIFCVIFLASTGKPNPEVQVEYLAKFGSFLAPVLTLAAICIAYKQLKSTAQSNHEQLYFAPLLNTFISKLDKSYRNLIEAQEQILPSHETFSLHLAETGTHLNFHLRLLGEIEPAGRSQSEVIEFIEDHKMELFRLIQEVELYLSLYEKALQNLSVDSSTLLEQICESELIHVIRVLNALSCLTGTFCSIDFDRLDQFEKRIDKLTVLAIYEANLDEDAECKSDIKQRCVDNWQQDP